MLYAQDACIVSDTFIAITVIHIGKFPKAKLEHVQPNLIETVIVIVLHDDIHNHALLQKNFLISRMYPLDVVEFL